MIILHSGRQHQHTSSTAWPNSLIDSSWGLTKDQSYDNLIVHSVEVFLGMPSIVTTQCRRNYRCEQSESEGAARGHGLFAAIISKATVL